MNKVKYTRTEYRNEYLKSDEWIQKRNNYISTNQMCEKCGKQATEVHHIEYRNLMDITNECLMSVCRECHIFIHECIETKLIAKSKDKIGLVEKRKQILTTTKDDLQKRKQWLGNKKLLSDDILEWIYESPRQLQQRIFGILKYTPNHIKDLDDKLMNGKEIEKIDTLLKRFFGKTYCKKYE